ncbi:unnamed protein product [Fraxinus pennsylvanica]|uniref:Transmembrane 9 superfamily member n=1 Tax=Fraxinus pennsylvanica TaxID=56036 RepID=A0AAD1Z8T3_9LAMI|nr:unnamed protein product [Fraxinus pennsylvanica]
MKEDRPPSPHPAEPEYKPESEPVKVEAPISEPPDLLGLDDPIPADHSKINKEIPRKIPEKAWYMNPVFSIIIGGILPFGAVFIELFFILTSIWLHQFYYIFGSLFLVFVILIITCAEITIVLCYFQLCSEDYLWSWRSYLTSGSSALYLFLYASFYFFTKLDITKAVSGVLYFGYMLIASYAFFVLTDDSEISDSAMVSTIRISMKGKKSMRSLFFQQ